MTAHAQAWWGVPRGGRVNGGLQAVQEESREQGEATHSPAGLNTHTETLSHTRKQRVSSMRLTDFI